MRVPMEGPSNYESKPKKLQKRVFNILAIDPGIRDVWMQRCSKKFDMIIKCIDSRLALREKGATFRAATQMIREALGCDIMQVFVKRV